jgi:multiple sugar transport system permease protein
MKDPTGRGVQIAGWIFASLLAFLLFVPFFVTVWKSLLSLDPAFPTRFGSFVGFHNYMELFFNEPEFSDSLQTTGIFLAAGLGQCVVAFLLALWLHRLWPRRLPPYLIAVLALPFVLSPSVVGLMGILYLHDQVGLITRAARDLGLIAEATAPLASTAGAILSICLLDAWRWIPITALFFWLGFRVVPQRETEAALVDGISPVATLRYLLLPRAAAVIGIILLIRLLDSFRLFDIATILTGGGPGTSTMTVSLYANRLTFIQQRFGLAAAHLTILYFGVAILVFPLIQRASKFRNQLKAGRL